VLQFDVYIAVKLTALQFLQGINPDENFIWHRFQVKLSLFAFSYAFLNKTQSTLYQGN